MSNAERYRAEQLASMPCLFIPPGITKGCMLLALPSGTYMTCAEGPYVRHVYRVHNTPIRFACDVETLAIIEYAPRGEKPVSLD
jgi:hypothetical protein